MNMGFWGIPGTNKFTKVHLARGIFNSNRNPYCGVKLSDKMEFQFVSSTYQPIQYIECETCCNKLKTMLIKEAKKLKGN